MTTFLALAVMLGGSACRSFAQGHEPRPTERTKLKTIRDLLWVWGNPEMTKAGPHAVATFAEASPAQRAQLLGVPNVVMAGNGIPNDDPEADRLSKEVAEFPQLVWEISADGTGEGRPFVYEQRMAQVRRLVDRYPQIQGARLASTGGRCRRLLLLVLSTEAET
ncbi:MAG: hypothetical protein HY298_05355 [Verrucomicrobia bacterium]|nr:hypothetical protein [Verrucomicrobiota bacterium]